MSDIRWEDPPPASRGMSAAGIWIERLSPLMESPKRWAIIATKQTAKAAQTTRKNLTDRRVIMPGGRWEFAARTVDGEHRIYGRYLGPDEESAS